MKSFLLKALLIVLLIIPSGYTVAAGQDDVSQVDLESALTGTIQATDGAIAPEARERDGDTKVTNQAFKAYLLIDQKFARKLKLSFFEPLPQYWEVHSQDVTIQWNNQEKTTEIEKFETFVENFFKENPYPEFPVVMVTDLELSESFLRQCRTAVSEGVLNRTQLNTFGIKYFRPPMNPTPCERYHGNIPCTVLKPSIKELRNMGKMIKKASPVFLLPYNHTIQSRGVKGLWQKKERAEEFIREKFDASHIVYLHKLENQTELDFQQIRFQANECFDDVPLMVKFGAMFELPMGSKIVVIGSSEELGGISDKEFGFLSIYFDVCRVWGEDNKATGKAIEKFLENLNVENTAEIAQIAEDEVASGTEKTNPSGNNVEEEKGNEAVEKDGWLHVRNVAESRGFKVDWEPKDNVPVWVSLTKDGVVVELEFDKDYATLTKGVASYTVKGYKPKLKDWHTYLPDAYLNKILFEAENFMALLIDENGKKWVQVRHYAEKSGFDVDWYPKDGFEWASLKKGDLVFKIEKDKSFVMVEDFGKRKTSYLEISEPTLIDSHHIFLRPKDLKKILDYQKKD